MGYVLIVTEKPDAGKNIGKVLGCDKSFKGYIRNDKYIITWCIGHLVRYYMPEEYDEKYKRRDYNNLPHIPDMFKWKVDESKIAQFNVVKSLMTSDEVDEVICATDSGREGQAIYEYVHILAGCRKPVKRLWISSLTPSAIKKGMANLKPNSDYKNLYLSAKCRAECDYLVGLNSSMAFGIKFNIKEISIGRVVTPTLQMVVSRHNEIKSFKPQDYWEISVNYSKGFNALWIDKVTEENRIFDKALAERIYQKVKGKSGKVVDIKVEDKETLHPLLYDINAIYKDTDKKFGYNSDKTYKVLQSLYETHHLITYPRTDSQHLGTDNVPELKNIISAVGIAPYTAYADELLKLNNLPITKRIVDDSKLSDHHAIIPTDKVPKLDELSDDEKKIYDLIVRRFLCVFFPTYKYTSTVVNTNIDNEHFVSRGIRVNDLGWKALYKDSMEIAEDTEEKDKDDTQKIPNLSINDVLPTGDTKLNQKVTTPPKYYTDATLIEAMIHCAKHLLKDMKNKDDIDEEVLASLKESGIGTPATRHIIVKKLFDTGYADRQGKYIVPTNKGMSLIDVVIDEIKSPEMTGKWEKALNAIAQGKMNPDTFMASIKKFVVFIVEQCKTLDKEFKQESIGKCKLCNSDVYEDRYSYYCSKYKESCSFSVQKENPLLAKYKIKKIPLDLMKQLLVYNSVTVQLGNKKLKARLVQNDKYWNIEFDFDEAEIVSIGKCPEVNCNGLIVEKSTVWGCTNSDKGCGFFLQKSDNKMKKYGKKMTESIVKQLVTSGHAKVKGFNGSKGKFDADIYLTKGEQYWGWQFKLNDEKSQEDKTGVFLCKCPDCNGNINMFIDKYLCDNKACGNKIYKNGLDKYNLKIVNQALAKELFEHRRSLNQLDFSSSKGKYKALVEVKDIKKGYLGLAFVK